MTKHYSQNKSGAVVDTNLDGVIVDTDGDVVEVRDFKNISVFMIGTVSAAVTATAVLNVEGSHDGSFGGEEVTLDTTTFVSGASASTDIFSTSAHIPFMRVSATLSAADITAVITAGN